MNSHFIKFISLSVTFHLSVFGLLFAIVPNELEINSNNEHGSSALKISLLIEKTPPRKPPNKQLAVNPVVTKKTTPAATALLTELKNNTPAPQTIADTTTPTKQLITNIENDQANTPDHVKINQILREELSRHFYYPAAAERRHWQGKVLIKFTVTPSGDITQIHINSSSGYEILDNAAIEALSKITTHDKFALALKGHSIEKTLPIIYELASR